MDKEKVTCDLSDVEHYAHGHALANYNPTESSRCDYCEDPFDLQNFERGWTCKCVLLFLLTSIAGTRGAVVC